MFKAFCKSDSEIIAQAELKEAKRQLLAAQSAAEHAAQIATYHSARFKRLTLSIKAQEATQ